MAPEGRAYLAKQGERHIALAPLNATDVRPNDLNLGGKFLLCPTLRLPFFTDSLSKYW